MLLCGTLGRTPGLGSGAPRRRRRGLHGRLLHREDGLLGLRLLHEELLLLHGDHHLLPARERSTRAPRTEDEVARREPCVQPADEPGDYQMACVKQAVVRHLPAIDATEGKDEVAVLCDKLCDDIRAGLLEAIDKACPGQPAYIWVVSRSTAPPRGRSCSRSAILNFARRTAR